MKRPGSISISGSALPKCSVIAAMMASPNWSISGTVVAIAGREAAAQVHHAQVDAGLGQVGEQHRHLADRHLIGARRGLLAADVERQAVRVQPHLAGAQHQLPRHLDRGAELARQRPVGALVLHQDAAIDPRARRVLRQLLQFLGANRTQTASRRAACARRIADTFLMVLPKLIASGARAGVQAGSDLLEAGRIEAAGRAAPAAPAPGAPDWPSRHNRCAPAASAR